MAMDDDNSNAWQLWRISPVDGSQIELVAEADTRNELRRLSKGKPRLGRPRLDSYKTYRNGRPSRS